MKRLMNTLLVLSIALISVTPLVIAVELESCGDVQMEELSETENSVETEESEETGFQIIETVPQISIDKSVESESLEPKDATVSRSSDAILGQREGPTVEIIKQDGFNNGQGKFVGSSTTDFLSDNLLSQTAEVKSLMPEIIEMGKHEIKFEVTHYHGFKNLTDMQQKPGYFMYDGVGPITTDIMNNEDVEETKLNFSQYDFDGDLTGKDFEMGNIDVQQKTPIMTGEGTPTKEVTIKGETKSWRTLYKATSTITIKTKEPLKPGLHFSIRPNATWVTTLASMEATTSKGVKLWYNPTKITSRVQFEKLDFQTTPPDTELSATKKDSDTKFEVGAKSVAGDPKQPVTDLGQTLAELKKQYQFKVFQSANGIPQEGSGMSVDDFIKKENEHLLDGLHYQLLFSREENPSRMGLNAFENTVYKGWGDIYQGKEKIIGLTAVLAVVNSSEEPVNDYPIIIGPVLRPYTKDTLPPNYETAYDPSDKVEVVFPVNKDEDPLTLLGELHRIYIKLAYDIHDGDDLIFKVQEEGKEEVTVTSKDESAFEIPLDIEGIYNFTSYAEDHSGNKSKKITWKVTIGNLVKPPELVLEDDSLTYTVDMKMDATSANPDNGQTSKLKVINANTNGYRLLVKRSETTDKNVEFPSDQLYLKTNQIGAYIRPQPTEIITLQETEKGEDILEYDLVKMLSFKGLDSSHLKTINGGKNTVTVSWELVTDDSKIASAESL